MWLKKHFRKFWISNSCLAGRSKTTFSIDLDATASVKLSCLLSSVSVLQMKINICQSMTLVCVFFLFHLNIRELPCRALDSTFCWRDVRVTDVCIFKIWNRKVSSVNCLFMTPWPGFARGTTTTAKTRGEAAMICQNLRESRGDWSKLQGCAKMNGDWLNLC